MRGLCSNTGSESTVGGADEIILKSLSKRELKHMTSHPVYGLYLFRGKVFSEVITYKSNDIMNNTSTAEFDKRLLLLSLQEIMMGYFMECFPDYFY